MEVHSPKCVKCKGRSGSQIFVTTDAGIVCLDCFIKEKEKDEDLIRG